MYSGNISLSLTKRNQLRRATAMSFHSLLFTRFGYVARCLAANTYGVFGRCCTVTAIQTHDIYLMLSGSFHLAKWNRCMSHSIYSIYKAITSFLRRPRIFNWCFCWTIAYCVVVLVYVYFFPSCVRLFLLCCFSMAGVPCCVCVLSKLCFEKTAPMTRWAG